MPKGTARREGGATAEPRVRRGYFECRYGQLHVHHVMPPGGGFEEGTPLLCLHDIGATARAFVRLLAILGRERSGYAPDLPGCGESDPAPHAAQLADYAAAIGDFLDNMRLRHIDLLGHRAGALLAAELAVLRPAQVRRVLLLSVPAAAGAGSATNIQQRPSPGQRWASDAAAHYPLRERLASAGQRVLLIRAHDELWDAAPRVRDLLPAARLTELRDRTPEPLIAAAAELADVVREFTRG